MDKYFDDKVFMKQSRKLGFCRLIMADCFDNSKIIAEFLQRYTEKLRYLPNRQESLINAFIKSAVEKQTAAML